MNKRRISTAIVGLTSLALIATACSGGGSGEGGTSSAGGSSVLTIGMPNGPQTDNSNPFANTSSAMSLGYAFAIYEPLAQVNTVRPSEDPTPWLASEWEWNADYTQLTLTARDGVKWSDGEDFTAEDIAYSFQIRKDNEGLNTFALPFGDIAVDGNKVTVSFTSGQFVKQGQILQLFVVPEHVWKDVEDPTTWTNEEPVGTGPYTLKSWTAQAATLTARDDYWGGELGVKELRYSSYNDNNALTNALVSGEAQWGWTFIPDYEKVYIDANPEVNNQWAPTGLGIDTLFLNTETAPFDDVAVRKAVQLVLDREQISELASSGVFPPLTNVAGLPEPAGTDFITAPFQGKDYTVDEAGAKQVLADAGYTLDGTTLKDPEGNAVTFTLTNPTGWSDYLTELQMIADAVKPLGITATVEGQNADAWFTAIAEGDFQASMHWTDGGATPWDTYSNQMDGAQYLPLGERAIWNFGRFKNDEATAALATYANATDEAARTAALETVQQVFVDEVPAIALLGRPAAAQYSTKNFVGWPSDEDPYANPQPTTANASLILTKLKPAE